VIFLRSQNVHFDGLRLEGVARITEDIDREMSSTRVKGGDVLLNITGASIGRTTVVPNGSPPMNVNQHVSILRPAMSSHAQWIQLWLRSEAGQIEMSQIQGGAARDGLSSDPIRSIRIALPPDSEQQQIVAAMDAGIRRIGTLEDLLTAQLEFLAEYREALITAAVSGEIHVDTFDSDRNLEVATP
jgi:type I restriction enzyme S subunit